MHMADALITPAVATTMYALSGVAAAVSIKKMDIKNDTKIAPLAGVLSAFVFAGQMINFTIPGTGSSGHICGGLLLASLLGPYAAFLSMIAILLVQCLFFADGGLLSLGCNVWNMAFYACFLGYLLIFKPLTARKKSAPVLIGASVLASVISLQLGAFSVVLETQLSGITELPFSVFVMSMQPIHLAIGTVEGILTGVVLVFLYNARPELLEKSDKNNRLSFKGILAVISIAAIFIGGMLSLIASSNPDGLEWSIGRVAGVEELEAAGSAYEVAAGIQDATALLPDYAFPNSESLIGTSFSGIIGALIVAAICIGLCLLIRTFKKNNPKTA